MSLILLRRRGLFDRVEPVPPVNGDPTYADRMVTINPGENWQAKFDAHPAGSLNNPIIFGITAGVHSRSFTLGAKPRSYQWVVGESDEVPTSRFPSGSPISVVQGGRTTAPGSDLFLESRVSPHTVGVKVVMLEVDGFSPGFDRYIMGGVGTVDWYWSHVNQHHASEGGIRAGWGMLMRHCWIHHNGRQGMSSNVQAGTGSRLQNVIIEDTTVDFNNQIGYAPNVAGSAAGGSKFIGTNGMIIRRCVWSNNGGAGIWFDGGSTGMQLLQNQCWDNVLGSRGGPGIFLEILDCTTGALVEDNDCRRNGDAANIYVSNTRGTSTNPVKVRNNYTEEHDQWEIMIQNTGTRSPLANWIEITDNICKRTIGSSRSSRRLVGVRTSDGAPSAASMEVVYDRNAYTWDPGNLGHSSPFQVDLSAVNWATWKSLGYDQNSSYQEV